MNIDSFSVSRSRTVESTSCVPIYIGCHSQSTSSLSYVHWCSRQSMVILVRFLLSCVHCGVEKKAVFHSLGDLVIDMSISDSEQHSLSDADPKTWNGLPDSLQSIRRVDSFKSALKTSMFNSVTPTNDLSPWASMPW